MTKYLKLFIVALFATMTFSLYSCSDDKDDEPITGEIVGTWKVSDVDPKLDTFPHPDDMNFDFTEYLQIQANGNYITVTIDEDGKEIDRGTWKLEGNTVTTTSYDELLEMYITGTSTVKKLTDKELVLYALGFTVTYKRVADSEIEKYLK